MKKKIETLCKRFETPYATQNNQAAKKKIKRPLYSRHTIPNAGVNQKDIEIKRLTEVAVNLQQKNTLLMDCNTRLKTKNIELIRKISNLNYPSLFAPKPKHKTIQQQSEENIVKTSKTNKCVVM